jgi:hypothetical protein
VLGIRQVDVELRSEPSRPNANRRVGQVKALPELSVCRNANNSDIPLALPDREKAFAERVLSGPRSVSSAFADDRDWGASGIVVPRHIPAP